MKIRLHGKDVFHCHPLPWLGHNIGSKGMWIWILWQVPLAFWNYHSINPNQGIPRHFIIRLFCQKCWRWCRPGDMSTHFEPQTGRLIVSVPRFRKAYDSWLEGIRIMLCQDIVVRHLFRDPYNHCVITSPLVLLQIDSTATKIHQHLPTKGQIINGKLRASSRKKWGGGS